MPDPRTLADTVRVSLIRANVTEDVYEASSAALSELVTLAERAATLEAENASMLHDKDEDVQAIYERARTAEERAAKLEAALAAAERQVRADHAYTASVAGSPCTCDYCREET